MHVSTSREPKISFPGPFSLAHFFLYQLIVFTPHAWWIIQRSTQMVYFSHVWTLLAGRIISWISNPRLCLSLNIKGKKMFILKQNYTHQISYQIWKLFLVLMKSVNFVRLKIEDHCRFSSICRKLMLLKNFMSLQMLL